MGARYNRYWTFTSTTTSTSTICVITNTIFYGVFLVGGGCQSSPSSYIGVIFHWRRHSLASSFIGVVIHRRRHSSASSFFGVDIHRRRRAVATSIIGVMNLWRRRTAAMSNMRTSISMVTNNDLFARRGPFHRRIF